MKRVTDILFKTIIALCCTLIIAVVPTEKDAAIYEDTLRLHILANSDRKEDQELKLRIRDRILEKYGKELSEACSIDEAQEKTYGLIAQIQSDVAEWIKDEGEDYGCEVTLGVEWYDTREYEEFTLPKGYYTSLKVMLGEAEGQNWWCVMYPPLCLDIACEDAEADDALLGYTNEEYSLITNSGYNVKFKLLEVLSEAFSK